MTIKDNVVFIVFIIFVFFNVGAFFSHLLILQWLITNGANKDSTIDNNGRVIDSNESTIDNNLDIARLTQFVKLQNTIISILNITKK